MPPTERISDCAAYTREPDERHELRHMAHHTTEQLCNLRQALCGVLHGQLAVQTTGGRARLPKQTHLHTRDTLQYSTVHGGSRRDIKN